MTRQEAATQLIKLYGIAVRLGFDDDNSAGAAVVAIAVSALLEDGDNK